MKTFPVTNFKRVL